MARGTIVAVWGLLLCSGGCVNPWQQHYTATPALKGVRLTPTESVEVRGVEPERLIAWATDAKQRRLQSNVAVEDLTTQDRIQETNRVLDAVRIQERAPTVRVIGFCEFAFGNPIPLDDPRLADFAKQVGADYAVVACQYAGQAQQTVLYPITTYSNADATAYVTGSNGYSASGYASGSGTSTTLVPIQVQSAVFVHTAVFVRRLRPEDPPFK